MFAKVMSLGVFALDGFVVGCEVDISGGLPQVNVVGLPDSAVKESTDRVRSALKNLKYEYPVSRVTVNLAPADVKKTGPVYDLPILLGILVAGGQMKPPPENAAYIGELSLDGAVRPVAGVLPMALAARKAGIAKLFLPRANAAEAAAVEGLQVYPLDTAADAVAFLADENALQAYQSGAVVTEEQPPKAIADFADVHGQLEARRAAEIAAVGMHNLLFVGTPGAGKSMLAKRLPGILPPMGYEEMLQTAKIYSVAGITTGAHGAGLLSTARPFRAPHHNASASALAGGGSPPRPGEISLAHNGVLFLDELPEFHRDALEILRQPLEEGQVTISRAAGNVSYPCLFMLVAAMNPCPCGYHGHPTKACSCTEATQARYLRKVSGPLLDRIDLHVEVKPVEYEAISSPKGGESSAAIAARVAKARAFAGERGGGLGAALTGDALRSACPMTPRAEAIVKNAFERLGLSARGYDKLLRVSRSIADLDAAEIIDTPHVSEAVQFRSLDRNFGHTN